MPLLRHRERIEGDLVVEVAFTDSSLGLGDAEEAAVRDDALARFAAASGARPVLMDQVHGAEVSTVDEWKPYDRRPTADALLTSRPGLALLARAADCVPVLLADPATGWVAAAHCGRPGLAAGVVPATVARLREEGARPAVAWIGPHVCGSCYEVPADLQDEVAAVVPEARSTTSWGTPALDLGAGVRAQLAAAGIPDVRVVDACTREDATWPSYRRDGAAATRFAGAIWVAR
ncbi:peptidoglycan editing factor PgeF [Nocardioides sp. zg-1228]|uniref:peptidoglycan editing factor PgeF n=1 Tax=Nocardioides sp. zg-1228 TaxID=2763008 RepID=UPI0016436A82|nr:peptidoglycan editing factor PgeF [Nocardioides sp. zg-1228]MBC2933539.1 peptidoglycan editing factor PgeF [Nocardioides sp. zg-1228]QSF56332.1 peptidoglycan editing factor PgeF [Nocardioides sp. zg-1228]